MCCEMYMSIYIYTLPFPLKFYFIWLSIIVGRFILVLEFYPTTEVACGFLFFCVLFQFLYSLHCHGFCAEIICFSDCHVLIAV